ncbi:hypothetical protein CCHL11_01775 [Colletotrichum chlorophyti]|uniref:Methyltransferase tdiE n=1 Tax=Colletotrichum chlorophyti TaxID=708187 RepID=A0A1Q8RVS7_9PEZI|nr:hypothetical protein CCHL11_01775 [Colletotrichum chlorophyti]
MKTGIWPSNPWPRDAKYKELGIWNGENMATGLEAFSLAALTRGHDWSRAEVEVFLMDVRKEIRNRGLHAYWPVYCVIGRKPEEGEPVPASGTVEDSTASSAAAPTST